MKVSWLWFSSYDYHWFMLALVLLSARRVVVAVQGWSTAAVPVATASNRFFLASAFLRRRPTTAALGTFSSFSSSVALYSGSSSSVMTSSSINPLLEDWASQPFKLPPFERIETDHFEPALQVAMQAHLDDLQAIVDDPAPATFDSVIAPYDRAGHLLDRVTGVYSNLGSSLNTDALQAVQTKMSPILSRHRSQTYTFPGLFAKIDAIYQTRHDNDNNNNLNAEQVRLVERIHMDFVRQGAQLDTAAQEELTEIKAQLATLRTQFQQNVLQDESNYELVVTADDLKGCPESLIQAARQAAQERGKADTDYVITLSRSLVEPFLVFCPNRPLRHKAWLAWTQRGELDDDRANLPLATQILKLRQRQAQLYGYKTYAEFQCADRMAKTPETVMKLLEDVWERAKISANQERLALEEYVQESGLDLEGGIQPWDWRFVAEKVRVAKYDFDESLLKPYLSLDSVRGAMFAVSENLFGLTYTPRPDLTTYHPDVDVFEVRHKETNKLVAIFLHDNFSRPYKSSGAWMSEYRSQTKNLGFLDEMEGIPVVSNNNNLAKGSGTTLLSYDDATTFFHEFGHGHHGMLSNATYGRLASTNVLTDFVELPSQLMEHWFSERQVLQKFARHYETGEPVPDELLDKLKAAESFNQGFGTIEYTICALMDMALHQVENLDDFDLLEFEKKELERLGMPQGITMRHRPAHFQHLFATEMYAAGYYVYLWAEVLDADAYAAFTETGDIFSNEVAEKAYKFIYSSGNTEAPDELFRQFRGRDPDISFMLKQKGLAVGSAKATVEKLLGCRVTCSLTDGRKIDGQLICVDRLSNLILADCTERRTLQSTDYNEYSSTPTSATAESNVQEREATRHLRQAMVPGAHLVKVEMLRSTYEGKVGSE